MDDSTTPRELEVLTLSGAVTLEMLATTIDGVVFVAVRPVCEMLGLSWSGQFERLQRAPWAIMSRVRTESRFSSLSAGKRPARDTVMIDRRTFVTWLATLDVDRLRPEYREQLESFQKESAKALDAYWFEGGVVNPRATEDQLDRIDDAVATRRAQIAAAIDYQKIIRSVHSIEELAGVPIPPPIDKDPTPLEREKLGGFPTRAALLGYLAARGEDPRRASALAKGLHSCWPLGHAPTYADLDAVWVRLRAAAR